MRKHFKRIIALMMLIMLLAVTPAMAFTDDQLYFVTDNADILTDEEDYALETAAAELSNTYGFGIYMVLVDSYLDFNSDIVECTRNIYYNYDLGYGSDCEGMILLVSISERDMYLSAEGYIANDVFGEDVRDAILDEVAAWFGEDDWAGGLRAFINESGMYLEDAQAVSGPVYSGDGYQSEYDPDYYSGKEYDSDYYDNGYAPDYDGVRYNVSDIFEGIMTVILGAVIIAGIVCFIFYRQMKSVHQGTTAFNYLTEDALKLTVREDRFMHSTQVRRKINNDNNGGSGGSKSGGGVRKGGLSRSGGMSRGGSRARSSRPSGGSRRKF